MKSLLALLSIALLSVAITACGSASKGAGSASGASSHATATGGAPATTASTGSTHTGRPPQTDNYIQTYGHEASPADKRAITALVKRYYAAAAADDGATACSLIYSILAEAIPEDYGQPPGPPALRGKTCAVVMSKLFKHVPGQSSADLATTKVTGVRLSGRHGFAQLSSRTMPTGEIVVEREHSSWKVGALIGRTCTRCAAGGAGQHG